MQLVMVSPEAKSKCYILSDSIFDAVLSSPVHFANDVTGSAF